MAVRHVFPIFICFVIAFTNTQDLVSPCPTFFRYIPRGNERNTWHGNVTLMSEEPLDGVRLKLILDKPALELGNWFGKVRTDDKITYRIDNRNHRLYPDSPHYLEIYVKYDTTKPVPQLKGIELNGNTICQGKEQITPRFQETPNQEMYECERPDTTAEIPVPLIWHGMISAEGEWPWHVALYTNIHGTLENICGGSVISDYFVITAAHCLMDSKSGVIQRASDILVYLGTTRINNFGSKRQVREIVRIILHTEYNPNSFQNDIAILKTDRPVNFTINVQPICLWPGNKNLSGAAGTVVGWGLDESGMRSDVLKHTTMLIVSNLECQESKPEFFEKYTSMLNFCASYRNGSSACNGDSGGGLVISQKDARNRTIWYLTGLVSISLRIPGTEKCDPDHFVIFTDVAKYIPWILKTMENVNNN